MKLALIGSGGMLASMIRRRACGEHTILPFDLPDFDITDREQVLRTLVPLNPDAIVNCAAFTHVDGCETQEELATRVNGHGPGFLAEAARESGARLVHVSTDYVFDGKKRDPYREDDSPAPLSAYGRSKLFGERAIQESGLESFYILRTSWLYGPGGRNFVETIVRLAAERDELRIVADQFGTPTYTGDLTEAILRLLNGDTPHGIYHFSNSGSCSWYEFTQEIVAELKKRASLKVERIMPIATDEYPLPAARPAYSVFSKEKYCRATGLDIPTWQESLKNYLAGRNEEESLSARIQ
jgi:dTDP-4-dehydrorhamnose reductase